SQPTRPFAPGLFSTTTGCPSSSLIFWPTVRAVKSAPPPGVKETTRRIGRVGKSCAVAAPVSTSVIPSAARNLISVLEVPVSHAHPHDRAEERLVHEDLRPRGADRAEHHDPLAQLALAVLDQLARAESRELVAFAVSHPFHDLPVELDRDVAHVALAHVVRPGVGRREMRQAP